MSSVDFIGLRSLWADAELEDLAAAIAGTVALHDRARLIRVIANFLYGRFVRELEDAICEFDGKKERGRAAGMRRKTGRLR